MNENYEVLEGETENAQNKGNEVVREEGNGKHLTTAEVSKILGITRKGVRYLVEAGKLTSHSTIQGKKKLIYLYSKEEVEEHKRGREEEANMTTLRREGEENPLLLHQIDYKNKSEKILFLKEKEELKQENKKLLIEVGRLQGLYQGKDEQIRQIQNILTERAESLIEKEAKVRELEDKLQKHTWQMKEELERERKEKEELTRILLFKNTPWWKKIFYTKEQLEKKIEKEQNDENKRREK